jgi:hypothetical protein
LRSSTIKARHSAGLFFALASYVVQNSKTVGEGSGSVLAGMTGTDVAEGHIDPPDAIAVSVQCRTHLSLHPIGKLLAAVVSLPGLPFGYFVRRPLKKPLFVVFCLMLAVSA